MSTLNFETVLYEKKDGIARLTINRPKQWNSLNLQLMIDLDNAFKDVEQDDSIGVAVLTGSGDKAFCAGADLRFIQELTREPNQAYKMLGQFIRLVHSMKTCGRPVVAAVNGVAIGGAGELLCPCDIIIAAEHARFTLGETSVGAVPIGGTTQWLTPIIGDKRARWLLLMDAEIDAKTACEWGLVNQVVPMDKLEETVNDVCQRLLSKSKWAVRFSKTQLNVWFDLVSDTLHQGRDFWTLEAMLPDLIKSTTAFAEKRAIDWIKTNEEQASTNSEYYFWGPLTRTCPQCNTGFLPQNLKYCGNCGSKLT